MLNKVILIGRLGADPEVRYLENSVALGKFSLATNENRRGQNGEWQEFTEWHNIVAWRQLAERLDQGYISKGDLIYVEGKINTRRYKDNNNEDRYITEIIARSLKRLDRTGSTDSGRPSEKLSPEPTKADPFSESEESTSANVPKKNKSEESDIHDDLPF